jgi:hypothetical protein
MEGPPLAPPPPPNQITVCYSPTKNRSVGIFVTKMLNLLNPKFFIYGHKPCSGSSKNELGSEGLKLICNSQKYGKLFARSFLNSYRYRTILLCYRTGFSVTGRLRRLPVAFSKPRYGNVTKFFSATHLHTIQQ